MEKKTRLLKSGTDYALIIPRELIESAGISERNEMELIEVKPGVWMVMKGAEIIPPVKEEKKEEKKPGIVLSPDELRILKKLDKIAYTERIPAQVNGLFSGVEKEVINSLLKKEYLRIYKGGKYSKTGVYDIANDVYPLLRNPLAAIPTGPPEKTSENAKLGWREHLDKYGYLVIENEEEAKMISSALEEATRKGEILGVRGFDKKYYIASRPFYLAWNERITPLLRGTEKTVEDAAKELKMSEIACKVALELMREEGEILEKRKGFYTLL